MRRGTARAADRQSKRVIRQQVDIHQLVITREQAAQRWAIQTKVSLQVVQLEL